MRQLIIVDDEKKIRMGLHAMIERQFPGRFGMELAANGEEALEILSHRRIDLVITDIRMPVMDGIALIRSLHASERKPAVIILSGHDDFIYAKEAIHCEVKEYLLKPIVREELFQALERLESELVRRERESEQLRESGLQRRAFVESQLNLMLLGPELQPEEALGRLSGLELGWLEEGFQLAVFQPLRSSDAAPEGAWGLLERLMPASGTAAGEACLLFRDQAGRPLLLSSCREQVSSLADQALRQKLLAFRVGVSGWNRGAAELKRGYAQAQEALKYSFLQAGPGLLPYEAVMHREAGYILPLEKIQKLSNLLGMNREPEMKSLLHELLDPQVLNRYDISYLEGLGSALNEHVFDKAFHIYGKESVEILKLYKQVGDPYSFGHLHEYVRGVESLLLRLNDYVLAMKDTHVGHREMRSAVDYIHDNYGRSLNMAMVANHISLSYTYFSESFKEFTGESFPNYLKKVRVEKAKQLLEASDLLVYEISGQVGFENSKHFNRVFKELEGVTPQEYRMQRRVWSSREEPSGCGPT